MSERCHKCGRFKPKAKSCCLSIEELHRKVDQVLVEHNLRRAILDARDQPQERVFVHVGRNYGKSQRMNDIARRFEL